MWNTYFYHGTQYENFEAIFPNFKIPLNKQHNHMFSCSLAPVRSYNVGNNESCICF